MYENKSRKELIAALKSINDELFKIKKENEQLKAQLNNNKNITVDKLRIEVAKELSNLEKQKKIMQLLLMILEY